MNRVIAASVVGATLLAAPALAQEEGADLFETYCSACHGSQGVGVPGFAPALDRPDFWQALDGQAAEYLTGVITKGFSGPITVRGERFVGMAMPPVADTPDDELAQVATWVLSSLGKVDLSVTPEDIAASRDSGLTHADLKAIRPEAE